MDELDLHVSTFSACLIGGCSNKEEFSLVFNKTILVRYDEEHIFNAFHKNCLKRLTNISLDNFLISHSSSIVWYCYNQWQGTKRDNREPYNLADVLSPGRTSILFLPIKDNYILKHILYGTKWFWALLLESSKERILTNSKCAPPSDEIAIVYFLSLAI